MGWLFRILGIADLLAAYALIARDFHLFGIGIALGIVLIGKGFSSLFGDWASRAFGIADIVAGFFIVLGMAFFPADIAVFAILVYKGVVSLF